jgi:hypothetical protein
VCADKRTLAKKSQRSAENADRWFFFDSGDPTVAIVHDLSAEAQRVSAMSFAPYVGSLVGRAGSAGGVGL